MQSGIYIIFNIKNKKIYVGSTVDFDHRFAEHKNRLKNNNHSNSHLQNAWNKYGEDCFTFIKYISVQVEKLIIEEQKYIDLWKPEYNKSPLASSSLGRKASEETKKKISESKSGSKHPNFGKETPKEVRDKISRSLSGANHPNFGKKLSDETREKMRQSSSGPKNHNFGKPKSDEVKEKIRESKTGKRHSEETKSKMSIARKRYLDKKKETQQ